MTSIAQSAALSALGPHLPALSALCMGSWEDYQSYDPAHRAIHDSTTRANIVHAHWVDRASRFAETTDGSELLSLSRLKLLIVNVDGAVFAVRMKKVDAELRSANVVTQQVEDFRNQEPLDGMSGACHLELGYMLNAPATAISAVYLVCPSGDGIAWSVELKAESVETVLADRDEYRQDMAESDEGASLRPKLPDSGDYAAPLQGTTGHET